jgi:uncharacterized SAM-binding protein YcdF (DUF218 family)
LNLTEGEQLLVSRIKEEDLTFEIVDRLLFQGLEDTGEDADCIIVLGSVKATQYRVPVAVDAYNAGRANKLMLCGGALRDFPVGKCSEAEHMYKAALELGVVEENIILENSSQNTVENILFALIELQRAFWLNKVRRVLLVTTAYHMRRSLAIARYLFPKHIAIVPCPANDNNTRRDNWVNTPVGIERAKGEAMNIVRCVINGVIPDFEI